MTTAAPAAAAATTVCGGGVGCGQQGALPAGGHRAAYRQTATRIYI